MPSVSIGPPRQQQPNELQQFGQVLSQLGLDLGDQDLKRQQIEGVRDPNQHLVTAATADPNHVRKLAEAYLKRKR